MEEWLGEISIEKSLQEIKEMLVKLSNDVDKIKEAVRNYDVEERWDYWDEAMKNKTVVEFDSSYNLGEEE